MTHLRSVFPLWGDKEFLSVKLGRFRKLCQNKNFLFLKLFHWIEYVHFEEIDVESYFSRTPASDWFCYSGLYQQLLTPDQNTIEEYYKMCWFWKVCVIFFQSTFLTMSVPDVAQVWKVTNHSKWRVSSIKLAPCMAAPDIKTHIRDHWEVLLRW